MSLRDDVLNAARSRSNLNYRLDPPPDGTTTTDCSLLIVDSLRDAGIPLPRGVRTAEQIRQATTVVPWADVKPGDLLFFENTYDASGPAGPDGKIASHVGFSLGAGTKRMLDAHERAGADVAETDISGDYWQDKLIEARRPAGLVDDVATAADTVRGIDVASHQGNVNWVAVADAGIGFGFTKATGGTWYRNPTFAANWLGMKAAGLPRGAYHYAFESSGQPLPGDGPEAEADYFVAELKRAGGVDTGDMVALDIEDGNGPLGEWSLRWLKRVEALTGARPFVYTGAWFSEPHGFGSVPALRDYPLWLASYQDEMPPAPAPWSDIVIWQNSSSGRVSGVAGDVDLNVFNGDASRLAFYGKPGAVVTPPSEYSVGPGVLALMAQHGDQPGSDEIYPNPFWSETMATSGAYYRWLKSTGQTFRYLPAA